ncbi:MAG: DNA-binding protein [Betaproteobacteria bacterium]
MKKFLAGGLGLAALAVIVAGAVFAEPGQGPQAGPGYCNGCGMGTGRGAGRMYDPARVVTVLGQVVSVEHIAAPRGRGTGVVLKVNTGSETLSVHLGPQWFIDKQEMKFSAGDTVEVKGAKAERVGGDVFLAAEVKKGSDVLKLRDDRGIPVWAGWRRTENKS